MNLPVAHRAVTNTDDFPQTLSVGAKGVETEETQGILSHFIKGDIKMNQTIA